MNLGRELLKGNRDVVPHAEAEKVTPIFCSLSAFENRSIDPKGSTSHLAFNLVLDRINSQFLIIYFQVAHLLGQGPRGDFQHASSALELQQRKKTLR